MLTESNVEAGSIDANGSYKPCAELCPDCPRRTGERKVKAKGLLGMLGKKVLRRVHDSPLTSGVLKSFQTNGRNGVFYGESAENTGTVTGLNEVTAVDLVKAIIKCEGPEKGGNVCSALGPTSYNAVLDLDSSMEVEIDRLPLDEMLETLAANATRVPADLLPDTQVLVNDSQPGSSA